jgi:hypothetical protein
MTSDLLSYGNLSIPEPGSAASATSELSFSLAAFCLMGLPLYKPTNPTQNFVRRSPGKYALTIRPFEITLDDGTELRVPIPFGVMPRYAIFWIMTHQGVEPGDRAEGKGGPTPLSEGPARAAGLCGLQPSACRG